MRGKCIYDKHFSSPSSKIAVNNLFLLLINISYKLIIEKKKKEKKKGHSWVYMGIYKHFGARNLKHSAPPPLVTSNDGNKPTSMWYNIIVAPCTTHALLTIVRPLRSGSRSVHTTGEPDGSENTRRHCDNRLVHQRDNNLRFNSENTSGSRGSTDSRHTSCVTY